MGSVLLEGHISDNGQYTGDYLTLLDEPIRDTIVKNNCIYNVLSSLDQPALLVKSLLTS